MALNFPNSPALNDIYTDSVSGFSYQWNGTVWISFSAASSSQIKTLDDISASFNSSTTIFPLTSSGNAITPPSPQSLIINLGGVVQDPTDDYSVSGSNIIFTTPPTSGLSFSGVSLGPAIPITTIPNGTVTDGSLTVAGILSTSNLFVTGISTFVGLATHTGTIFGSNLSLTDIATASSVTVGSAVTINSSGINVTGITTIKNASGTVTIGIGTTALLVEGNARVTGILTVGSASITLNGTSNIINVGTGLTLSSGGINITGVITATSFSGTLTGAATSTTNIPNLTGAITSVNTTTSLGSFSSSNLATALTDETGSGANVFATSPTLVTPVLGTPSSGTLTSCTGLPLTTGVTGTLPVANGGTGVTAASTGSGGVVLSTSPTLTTPVLGTPSSGTLSSCTVDGTDAVGFRNIPQNSQSTAYTLVLADNGKHIFHPVGDNNARTFTIPANSSVAYPIGTALTFINMAVAAVTIAITTDTLTLSSAGTTGSRTLAQYGSATCIKITSTSWLISGSGLT